MKLRPEELKEGEVYFFGFGESTQLIARLKENTTTRCYFFSEIKIWLGRESFLKSDYCTHQAMTDLRPATEAEKAKLEKYEAENGVEYKEMGGKRQEFFNFLEGHFGITPTETGMSDIIQEALKLQPKPTETPLTAERLPEEFKENHTVSDRIFEKIINKNLTIGLNFTSSKIYICKDFLCSGDTQKCWREDFTESKLNEIHQFLTGESIQFGELEEALNEDLINEIAELQMELYNSELKIKNLESTIETQALIFAKTHAAVEKYRNELLND